MEHLQELKVVITAAASGLGSDIATTLSKNGSKVFICDNNELALKNFSEKNPIDLYNFMERLGEKSSKNSCLITDAGSNYYIGGQVWKFKNFCLQRNYFMRRF